MSRIGASAYLDDMDTIPGDIVICKSDITGMSFTPDKPYRVMPNGMLIDDDGELVRPSARFYRKKKT